VPSGSAGLQAQVIAYDAFRVVLFRASCYKLQIEKDIEATDERQLTTGN
jgi:hypothetical protein